MLYERNRYPMSQDGLTSQDLILPKVKRNCFRAGKDIEDLGVTSKQIRAVTELVVPALEILSDEERRSGWQITNRPQQIESVYFLHERDFQRFAAAFFE